MTDLPMLLLNTLGSSAIQPANYCFDNEGDDGHSFQSSLEALVNTVADELLEEEIPVEPEPLYSDGTAALMMLLIAPPRWDPMRETAAQGLAAPPPAGARGLEAPVITYPSIPNRVDMPVSSESDSGAPQQATSPLLVDTEDAQDKEVRSAETEMKAPVVNETIGAVRKERPAIEKCPSQLPPDSHSQGTPAEDTKQTDATAPKEYDTRPRVEIGRPDAAEDQGAMFLASSRLVVRNPVPRSTKQEQTAFEVEISDEIEEGLQMEEPSDVLSPRVVKEKRNIDDRTVAEGSVSTLQGFVQSTSDGRADTQPPQPEAPKANGVTPIANTPSAAKESVSCTEKEPPQREPSGPAALEHHQDKPRAFQASTGLQLRVGPREEVSIHVHQIAGNVRISVRSVDADLTKELQAGVPNLLAVLNESGVRAEATIPEIGSPIAEGRESTISNIANGNSGSPQEGSGDASGESSGQNRRHRRPDQQWEEWLEER